MLLTSQAWGLLLLLLIPLTVSIAYLAALYLATRELPRTAAVPLPEEKFLKEQPLPKISVVVPAFNEAANIEACVRSVLSSTLLPDSVLEFWVVDDRSTDQTWEILQKLEQDITDPRLKLLSGTDRPAHETWTGKNWACFQGSQCAQGDWLLFLDADVRLKPGAIAAVIQLAIEHQLDLITCIPKIINVSLIEWLVQPLMFINVMVAFNSAKVKDPRSPLTYALGPFLLFRRSAYDQVDGHAGIASYIAEDVAFARKLKRQGYRVYHLLAANLVDLRMYRNWRDLWEGWTKVLYVGANRNLGSMLLLMTVMLSIYTLPWLSLGIALVMPGYTASHKVVLVYAILSIGLQYQIRAVGSRALGTQSRYWWLQGIGGAIVALLAMASVVKTETGWGWTWRGRSLKMNR